MFLARVGNGIDANRPPNHVRTAVCRHTKRQQSNCRLSMSTNECPGPDAFNATKAGGAARIILLAASGLGVEETADELGIWRKTAARGGAVGWTRRQPPAWRRV